MRASAITAGVFLEKKFWGGTYSCDNKADVFFPGKLVGKSLPPCKVCAFVWEAMWSKLNAVDRVQKRNPHIALLHKFVLGVLAIPY